MSEPRKTIPAKLERELMIESGYRCAICKAVDPLEIEHIEEYSDVQEHSFENMIVLCANCHRRKKNTNDARHINKMSLKKIKESLIFLNGRYTDLEKRFIQECKTVLEQNTQVIPSILIHHTMYLQVKYLVDDGYVDIMKISGGLTVATKDGVIVNDQLKLTLNEKGKAFILGLM